MEPTKLSDIVTTLERLVAFDTTSRNSNLALVDWAEDWLVSHGAVTRRVANDDGTKANLIATIGPMVEGGIVLSGHTDVVPVDGQPWTSDPWTITPREIDGVPKLFGRGTCDMKGFVACALAAAPHMAAAGLKKPIHFALSYDEEVGCLGAPRMVTAMAHEMPRIDAVIVGEPTSMKVVSGHKGITTFRVDIEGREAHSSLKGTGISAIMVAIPLMALVDTMAREAAANADPNSPFTPPGATMTVGLVEGGTALNILARTCSFSWDLRSPPDVNPEIYVQRFIEAAQRADAEIKAIAPEGFVRVTRRSNTPPLGPEIDGNAERLARALTGDNSPRVVAYAAEGGLFQQAGLSTIVCGPGSIEQAHQPDEWVEIDQLAQCGAFIDRLIAVQCQM